MKTSTLSVLKLFKKPQSKSEVYRLVSISTLMILLTTLLQPSPVDMLFILLIESFCMIVIMLVSYLLSMSLFVLFLGSICSIVLVPTLLLFLLAAMMMLVLMLGFDVIAEDAISPYPLINYAYTLINGEWQAGLIGIVDYFGTNLYWIVGSILVHHLIFDLFLFNRSNVSERVEKENSAIDLFFHFTYKAMIQSSVIMFVTLIMAIPVTIVVLFFKSQLWLAYIIVILIRIALEFANNQLGDSFKPDNKSKA